MTAFKPSQVSLLHSFPPLVDTFDRTELEVAAALILRTLSVRGDQWQPVELSQLMEVVHKDLDDADAAGEQHCPAELRAVRDLVRNPFCRPDFYGLVERGFALWTMPPPPNSPIRFTDLGLARLAKWVR